ncbi:MAG: BolA family transcriptional regulator [Gammaproteobacteria bacterium]|nr:MAG: BolA family transcriptional regulator [Gammaproteobacteria bacterium]
MAAQDRVALIRQRLEDALAPSLLDVVDESHEHVGHPGAADGRGHFSVTIVADAFSGLSLLERHRLVYDAMGELMDTDIHALSIQARSPAEARG